MPRSVSTEFKGEMPGADGSVKGLSEVGSGERGEVPKERAAITS